MKSQLKNGPSALPSRQASPDRHQSPPPPTIFKEVSNRVRITNHVADTTFMHALWRGSMDFCRGPFIGGALVPEQSTELSLVDPFRIYNYRRKVARLRV